MPKPNLKTLLTEIRACQVCAAHLPHPPRPVLRAKASARLLIVGQAPGRRVNETGIPWNDPSGDTLREWLQMTRAEFYDERRIAIVTARANGWIERLDVRANGDAVQRGQRLAGLYSPDLLAAQEEYLLAVRSDDAVLLPAARRRLELLGLSTGQLDRIVRRGATERQVDIVAPTNGVVTDLGVREGAAVTSGMAIMNLADLSEVWVIGEVPESQGAWLKAGQSAEVTLPGAGGEPVSGRLDYLYPEISAATRTVRVRVVVPNQGRALRPGMSARIAIQGQPRSVIVVPTEALIRSGERTAVILAEGEGRFRPVAVVAGLEQGDRTEIRAGLNAGDQVVVSGQFLIDSEANIGGVLDRLLPGEQKGDKP